MRARPPDHRRRQAGRARGVRACVPGLRSAADPPALRAAAAHAPGERQRRTAGQRGPARARGGYGASADRPARLRTDVPARLRDRACGRRGDRPPRRRGRRPRVLNAAILLGALVGSLLASTITLEWPSRPLPRRRPLRRSDHPSSLERPRRPPRCCWSPRSASASDRRRRCLHAARAPRARRRDSTHVRNLRSALDARRRVRRGLHVALIALLGSRGALLALRGRRASGRSDGMARPPRARPAHGRARRHIELLHEVALRRPLPQSTIEDVAPSLERVVFAPRATVFEEGEAGESFYIVAAGRAPVTRRGGHVGQLGPAASSARPSCCPATCRAPQRCEQPTTRSFMSACWPASASSPP
jgi:hypothetical protein